MERMKRDYRLTDEVLDEKCSEEHTYALEDIISDWKCVGRRLRGIGRKDIDDIDKDFNSEKRKTCALLELWHQRSGNDATYADVIQALLLEKYVDDANNVCKLIQPLTHNGKCVIYHFLTFPVIILLIFALLVSNTTFDSIDMPLRYRDNTMAPQSGSSSGSFKAMCAAFWHCFHPRTELEASRSARADSTSLVPNSSFTSEFSGQYIDLSYR